MRLLVLLIVLCASTAQAWTEPKRGTQTRADMMSAIRPHMEWVVGPPVEFVIQDLRVSGNVGFAAVYAQRPGGGEINIYATPGYARGNIDPVNMDGSTLQALLQKSGNVWVATHYAIGATDVWYSWDAFCPVWSAVLTEFCN